MSGLPKSLGKLVANYRKQRGLTQEELAGRAGLSHRTVQDIERGKSSVPHENTLQRLIDALGLSFEERTQLELMVLEARRRAQIHRSSRLDTFRKQKDISLRLFHFNFCAPSRKFALLVACAIFLLGSILLLLALRTDERLDNISLSVIGDVHFSGLSVADDGRPFIHRSQLITVTFLLRNTGTQTALIESFGAGGRGPDVCQKAWEAYIQDFPMRQVILQPGEDYLYEESRSFDTPGVYFVEPVAKLRGRVWGGIQPFQRIYFIVMNTSVEQLSADLSCITPQPTPTTSIHPKNDNFTNATVITQLPFQLNVDTRSATTETGEPLEPNIAHTVWYQFTPTTTMGLFATGNTDFDIFILVYSGSRVDALANLGGIGSGGPISTTFLTPFIANQTYYLQVSSVLATTGSIRLEPVP